MIRVEDLCSLLPRGTIAELMALEGPVLRKCADHGPGRFLIRNFTHGGVGRLSVGIARKTGLLKGRRPVELALSVLRYFFEPFLEEVLVTEEAAVFFLNQCPYGWRVRGDERLCNAVMQLERELVSGIGGELVIEETIPQGATKCRFTIRSGSTKT